MTDAALHLLEQKLRQPGRHWKLYRTCSRVGRDCVRCGFHQRFKHAVALGKAFCVRCFLELVGAPQELVEEPLRLSGIAYTKEGDLELRVHERVQRLPDRPESLYDTEAWAAGGTPTIEVFKDFKKFATGDDVHAKRFGRDVP